VQSVADTLAPPEDVATFERCKLDWSERDTHHEALAFHKELIALRRAYSTELLDGAVLSDHALVLRFRDARLLLVNLVAEPLLAPPAGCEWSVLWSSSEEEFEEWRIPAESAVLLKPTTPSS
jgi:maltooligosyltrehalose trehalohydrolase